MLAATQAFFASAALWREALVAALIAGAALGYLGVWVVLRRIVFVPLAISQAASLGVIAAFLGHDLLAAWLGATHEQVETLLDPVWLSLVAALAAAAYFAARGGRGADATAVVYALAAAGGLLLGGFIRADLHDVQSVLFGNAVLVETSKVLAIGLAALAMGAIHLLAYRRFLFVGFDPDSASAAGLPVRLHQLLLYGSIALVISTTTRVIGALPVFGLLVLPGMAGLALGRSMGRAFLVAGLLGFVAAGLGYYLSFVLELPTGAAMVAAAGALYAPIALSGRARGD